MNRTHMIENLNAYDFQLADSDVKLLSSRPQDMCTVRGEREVVWTQLNLDLVFFFFLPDGPRLLRVRPAPLIKVAV